MRILPSLFWAALVATFVLSTLPATPVPEAVSDKVQHLTAFALLAGLAAAAYPKRSPLRIGIGLAAFGAAIELIQLIPALNRYGDVGDWIADLAGIALGLGFAALVRREPGG